MKIYSAPAHIGIPCLLNEKSMASIMSSCIIAMVTLALVASAEKSDKESLTFDGHALCGQLERK